MRKENWFLTGLILAVLSLMFFYPSLGWKIQGFFSSVKSPQSDEYRKLVLENESLNAEILSLQKIKRNIRTGSDVFLPVFVYSRYPFSFKNELLVSAGTNQDVRVGAAVVIASGYNVSSGPILVGKVEKVFGDASLVETIFDSRFQAAVRIGSSGTNALLKGGNEPELSLISKEAKIADGDTVYSASPDFPYGLPIGAANNVRASSDQLFQEANVETNYNPNELQSLSIMLNYHAP